MSSIWPEATWRPSITAGTTRDVKSSIWGQAKAAATGTGYSVLELVKSFEEATGVSIPYEITDRRPGDIATCYADTAKAEKVLGWKAEKGIREMCEDAWRWQQNTP